MAELREEVSLQVVLRMEEEVTKTLQLVAGLYTRLGQQVGERRRSCARCSARSTRIEIERDLIDQIEERGSREAKSLGESGERVRAGVPRAGPSVGSARGAC